MSVRQTIPERNGHGAGMAVRRYRLRMGDGDGCDDRQRQLDDALATAGGNLAWRDLLATEWLFGG